MSLLLVTLVVSSALSQVSAVTAVKVLSAGIERVLENSGDAGIRVR